ncbi:hypothetical protein AKJ08_2707 [Vulgatibacter incomptus]|uniref:Uncharacterized protein n=1 Tax=Vulgatibacter incomptus TaxID=1391653 RepID=A0A0K1PFM3_9BACT|nr:hypothetical protein AKJ08_2707 [Vulgatibacter incomptus]
MGGHCTASFVSRSGQDPAKAMHLPSHAKCTPRAKSLPSCANGSISESRSSFSRGCRECPRMRCRSSPELGGSIRRGTPPAVRFVC